MCRVKPQICSVTAAVGVRGDFWLMAGGLIVLCFTQGAYGLYNGAFLGAYGVGGGPQGAAKLSPSGGCQGLCKGAELGKYGGVDTHTGAGGLYTGGHGAQYAVKLAQVEPHGVGIQGLQVVQLVLCKNALICTRGQVAGGCGGGLCTTGCGGVGAGGAGVCKAVAVV